VAPVPGPEDVVTAAPYEPPPLLGWCAARQGSRPLVLAGHHDDHDGSARHWRGPTCRGFVGDAGYQAEANARRDAARAADGDPWRHG
jgi:hypothetical protein